jgi:hypothetical protein
MRRRMETRGATVVWSDPADVFRRLAELGLSPDPLRQAVARGEAERASCTENDPAAEIGIFVWGRTVRFLREALRAVGWIRNKNENVHTTISPDKKIAIAVAAGDAGTGDLNATPRTKYERGEQTRAVVDRQYSLLPPELPIAPDPKDGLLYVLLVYPAVDGVRCELSLPTQIGKDGRITSWRERIVLAIVPRPDVPGSDIDRGPEIDVPVSRRKSS